jgi:nitroimidazol reductase NimA-like FMN-containing flavoprotein (pyridoxamine 5'-phosphate oxidase superfamily)
MSTAMTKAEREAFLAGVHVAVISVPETGRGPLTVPVWYNYEPGGEVLIWTGGNSRKVRLLRQTDRFSVCVQQETPPYKYVSVEGPVVAIEPIDLRRELRPLVYRYLGADEGEQFIEQLGGSSAGTGDVLIRMRPERWLSEDYSKTASS